MGIFAVRYARQKIKMLYAMYLFVRPLAGTFRAPVWSMVVLWFLVQLFWGIMTYQLGLPISVAYWAHIGGLLFGILLAVWLGIKQPASEPITLPDSERIPDDEPVEECPVLSQVDDMLRNGEIEQAREYCEKILATSPTNRDAHRALARVYKKTGDIERARSEYTIILNQVSRFGHHKRTANIYEEYRTLPEAIDLPVDVTFRVGMAYGALDRYADAVQLFNAVIQKSEPGDTDIRARTLFQLGKLTLEIYEDAPTARSYFQQFLDEYPEHDWRGAAHEYLEGLASL